MIERLAVALILLVVGYLVYRAYTGAQLARPVEADSLLRGRMPGIPAVLYFTTPTCIPCRTIQMPALTRLHDELGVQVLRVDATEQPEDADRWGVFSAPTTFIIDGKGKTHAVNHGVADFEKLKHQINQLRNAH
jgi:thiol-disulfide isomerase/thioredoxin